MLIPEPADGGDASIIEDASMIEDASITEDAAMADTAAPNTVELTIAIAGEGEGRVRASTGELNCTETCTQTYDRNTTLTLDALPLRSSTFAGWTGTPCAGLTPSCTLTLTESVTLTTHFQTPGNLPRYKKIEDLGPLPTGTTSWAWSINDAGAITGFADTAQGQRAFRVNAASTTMIALGTLGGDSSTGRSINASGWIAGDATLIDGYTHSVLYAPHPSTEAIDLGKIGGNNSYSNAINADNWIVGRSENAALQRRAFRKAPQEMMVDLGTLGGMNSTATDINDQGWTVGSAELANGDTHAFRMAPEPSRDMRDLGTIAGRSSVAYAINASGVVVGSSEVVSGNNHAMRIDPPPATAMIDLGTLGGSNSIAYELNDAGMVVGTSEDRAGISRAIVWDPVSELMIDLDELLPRDADEWSLRFAMDINNNGAIVGMGVHRGVMRAFRLTP